MARYVLEIWEDYGENRTIVFRNKNEVIAHLMGMIGDVSLRRTQ